MKTYLLAALAVALPATALPAPAAAQSVPMEDNPSANRRRAQAQAQQQGPAATRAELIRAVDCQFRADAAPLDALLAAAPYSPQEASAAETLLPLLRRCISARADFTTPTAALRGTVAEGVLKARFASPQAARSPVLAAKPLLDLAAATARPDAATLVTSYGMADCMGATQGAQVLALLATEPGTQAEADFFNTTLAPLLGQCAASAGGSGQISVDGRTLRGILAEALYRWSAVQRDGPSSPWARP